MGCEALVVEAQPSLAARGCACAVPLLRGSHHQACWQLLLGICQPPLDGVSLSNPLAGAFCAGKYKSLSQAWALQMQLQQLLSSAK